ncbi:glycosyl hydrolase 115 family protein [Mucilaginibacter mali]|uniref:glycosyl hydrolase 115 family protein n=1 Tax=Mucilaginibacter mali TaxID=2740462 RepID=UPI001F389A46|nr:glycosyl hydrolase 115 family protein [Mucilaginibacter mali]
MLNLQPVSAAIDTGNYVSNRAVAHAFPLSAGKASAPLYVSGDDFTGVVRAVKDLQHDITAVTNTQPALLMGKPSGKRVVIIGTIGHSPLVDGLIAAGKLNVKNIKGKWETYVLQVIDKPFPGLDQALVIAGSDKRGTIFGVYDLSSHIGVSPWYWWADVPVKQQASLYILPGRHTAGTPAIKYRGIFINDEAPAFSGWAKAKFGGVNHELYAHMFELILRLKGNYLWPAMWGNAFNDDDPLNRKTADDYGIVMGTSHHEPMDRAQQEWKRYGTGDWDYEKNGEVLRSFWRKGIENMGNAETIVTVGMRGDGDKPMQDGTNITLLENIVADQRKIIASVTGKPIEKTPQMWALYKEVQDYYDKGMRVPDDVTLLLCDDNWGNIRKLPELNAKPRAGGYGIYYHFDYVGGPRNYKWINTNPISKVWEQMHLAYQHRVDKVWIVNVGDLKPMEFPISFFLDYAWNPDKIGPGNLQAYTKQWASRQFGNKYAGDIAGILTTYTKYNGRRKPELLNENTYSLINYNEFETVVNDYQQLNNRADSLYKLMPQQYKDAYYELVLHPVAASANLYQLYYATALNHLYAKQGRAATNAMAAKVKALFDNDAAISAYYNTQLAGGKWAHMMDQTHIGYKIWQEPKRDTMPRITEITLPGKGSLGVAVEGSSDCWPGSSITPELSAFNNLERQRHFIELYNKGRTPVSYAINAEGFIRLSSSKGTIDQQSRIYVDVDWSKVPGTRLATINITGSDGTKIAVNARLNKLGNSNTKGFIQTEPAVAIEAAHYQKKVSDDRYQWIEIPGYGRTLSAMTVVPAVAVHKLAGNEKARLEYVVKFTDTGKVVIKAYLSPTIDFTRDKVLRYAISLDDEAPQLKPFNAEADPRTWSKAVSDNVNIITTQHHIAKAGTHVIKFWVQSPAVVLEKLVIDTGSGTKPSYLGPPENFRVD